MKASLLAALLVVAASPGFTQQISDPFIETTQAEIKDWGKAIDPGQDCKFFRSDSALIISVPASQNPHDFAPEIPLTNAPRVLQPVEGDFLYQVQVDDRFNPGDESILPGRASYYGAAIVAVVDDRNVVTFARAELKRPERETIAYANFEVRAGGKLLRAGVAADHPLPTAGAVFLRLERKGREVTGSVSMDGKEWSVVRSETLPKDWPAKLEVGVMAINSSRGGFSPQFSQGRLEK